MMPGYVMGLIWLGIFAAGGAWVARRYVVDARRVRRTRRGR